MFNTGKIHEVTSLGSKLKTTLVELEAANLKNLQDKANADIEKIRKQRQEKVELFEIITQTFINQIENNKVPYEKITNYTLQEWIRNARLGKAEFNDVWYQFVNYFKNEKCGVVIEEGHDGMGMESWIILSLTPQLTNMREIGYIPSKE